MKFLTWILIFCFASQAMASTVREGLEAAMNEFEYDMVVERDQKDKVKAEAFTKRLTDKLEDLYKQGLSNDILMKYIETRVMDKQQLAAIQASATLAAKNGASAENIANSLKENMEKFGQQGANWTGGVATAAIITGLVAVGALIIYQLVWNLNRQCVQAQTEERCGWEEYCSDYDRDQNGNQYCDEYDERWDCDDVEVCLQWEKK